MCRALFPNLEGWQRLMRLVAACIAAIALWLYLPIAANAQPQTCVRTDGISLRDVFWRHPAPSHPLMGQVLEAGGPITVESAHCVPTPLQQLIVEVWRTIRSGGIVLLGEVHDNPEHHRVRGDILWPRLERLVSTNGLQPAAVFEHIRTSQQAQLDRFSQLARSSRGVLGAAELLNEVGWETSGWPPGKTFEALFAGALSANLPIYPGNAPRDRTRALARGDGAGVTPQETGRLDVAHSMPDPLLRSLATELEASHCGAVPASAFVAMSLAQRYADAHMADVLVKAAEMHGAAFLLAGNGHIRSDRGVPWYLRRLAPSRKVVSVMLLEVEDGKADGSSYVPRAPDGVWAANYVLFTPRHVRPDPCEEMRQGKK